MPAKKRRPPKPRCLHINRKPCPLDARYDMCANSGCTDPLRDKRYADRPMPVKPEKINYRIEGSHAHIWTETNAEWEMCNICWRSRKKKPSRA